MRNVISDFFGFDREQSFELKTDDDGLALTLPKKQWETAQKGEIGYPAIQQLLTLKLLEEQGLAEEIGNGFFIDSDIAVQFDEDTRDQLNLPDPWFGSFRVQTSGTTSSVDFAPMLGLLKPNGQNAGHYHLEGPLIIFSENEKYLPNEAQWIALSAVQQHRSQMEAEEPPSETDNLLLISSIQKAMAAGLEIDLGPFRDLDVSVPSAIGVTVSETEDGDLELTPSLGVGENPDDVANRLGQVEGRTTGSLKVKDKIVVLDKDKMLGVQEVIKKRKIKKEHVPAFLENPTRFLNAALVDLDLGFSIRVKGATFFQLAYFGQTEETGIDWFTSASDDAKYFFGPKGVRELVKDLEKLQRFKELFEQCVRSSAQEFRWEKEVFFRFDDQDEVRVELEKIEDELNTESETGEKSQSGEPGLDGEQEDGEATGPVVPDIETQDDKSAFEVCDVPVTWEDALDRNELDLSGLRLSPYSYQEQGIRWILGLANDSLQLPDENKQLYGSLLADDMGLGKTFMSLAAIAEYYRRCKRDSEIERPILVVAPLSLLENWKDEVEKVFANSPFSDIVTLQSDADLTKFRVPGSGRETNQELEDVAGDADRFAGIEFSLKVGTAKYGIDALDQPKRLVLAGYSTLRDYMFSLSLVDWSFVIFDEAQNIKNPNALQTRAAKSLKAKFRLLVTGTPVENELRDFWCLLDTARPGLLGAYQDFRQEYVRPIFQANPDERAEIRQRVGEDLRGVVGGLMLRRLKEDNLDGLPTKTIRVGTDHVAQGEIFEPMLGVTMDGIQRDRYESVIGVTQAAIGTEEGQGAALKGLQQLRAISLHPDCVAGGTPAIPSSVKEVQLEFGKSGKLVKLLEILDEIKERKEKVIIFCINKKLQMLLQAGIGLNYNIAVHVINGDTKAVAKRKDSLTRKRLIQDFESQAGFGVIVMSPVAAGVGLTVVGANNVVHLERHWNPAKESQATDRVFRIGQEKPVNIYVPILKHPNFESFDVNMAKLLSSKVSLREAIVTPDVVTAEEVVASGIFGSEVNAKPIPVDVEQVYTSGWEFFEAFIAELLAKVHDAETILTPRSSDYGCDVVVLAADRQNRLIQCKHTRNKSLRGHSPIQEVVASREYYQDQFKKKFEHLDVYTNAHTYDADAKRTAKTYSVKLHRLKDLKNLMSKYPVTDQDVMQRLNRVRWGPSKK